ncbi:MAG: hypothetical protein ACRCXK_13450 [Wohlfahrtiimonas sp.]
MAAKIILDEYIIAKGIPQKTAVRQALETRLSKIKVDNGYWFDVEVYDSTKGPYNDSNVPYPFIQVMNSGVEMTSTSGESIQMKNTLTLLCVVQTDSEIDDTDFHLEKMEEDVLRCLFPDKIGLQKGAFNSLNVELVSMKYNTRELGDDEASLELTITFNTSIKAKKEP